MTIGIPVNERSVKTIHEYVQMVENAGLSWLEGHGKVYAMHLIYEERETTKDVFCNVASVACIPSSWAMRKFAEWFAERYWPEYSVCLLCGIVDLSSNCNECFCGGTIDDREPASEEDVADYFEDSYEIMDRELVANFWDEVFDSIVEDTMYTDIRDAILSIQRAESNLDRFAAVMYAAHLYHNRGFLLANDFFEGYGYLTEDEVEIIQNMGMEAYFGEDEVAAYMEEEWQN